MKRTLPNPREDHLTGQQKEEMRVAIRRGDCPFCGRSGFRLIARHINCAHALEKKELRDLVGFNYSESICSPDLSEQRRAAVEGKCPPPSPVRRGRAHPLSKAAMEKLRNIGKKRAGWTHGTKTGYGKGCRCSSCAKANAISSAKYRARAAGAIS